MFFIFRLILHTPRKTTTTSTRRRVVRRVDMPSDHRHVLRVDVFVSSPPRSHRDVFSSVLPCPVVVLTSRCRRAQGRLGSIRPRSAQDS